MHPTKLIEAKKDIDINNINNIKLSIENKFNIKEHIEKAYIEKESYNIDFTLTYYGTSEKENGGFEGITCTGKKLKEGMAASNYYELGTIIEFEDGSKVTISDKGGKDFDSPNRLDIYIDTYSDEVLNRLGRKKIKGKIIKNM